LAGEAGKVRSRRDVPVAGVEVGRVAGVRVVPSGRDRAVVGLAVVD
jgi:ABC-type transporter Mla subunit MlaD